MISHIVHVDSAGLTGSAYGADVSRDCTEFTVDGSVNTESEPTKVKIILANIGRKYDDIFTPQKDHFWIEAINVRNLGPTRSIPGEIIGLALDQMRAYADRYGVGYVRSNIFRGYSIEFTKIAKGLISDVACDDEYCEINGTCLIGDLADALPSHWSSNDLGPDIKSILTRVLSWHDPPVSVDFQASNPKLEQKQFDADATFQSVIDYCAQQVQGAVVFVDEVGILHFWDASMSRQDIDLDYNVTEQNKTQSLMNYNNVVTVFGDESYIPVGQPGSENSSMEQIQGEAKDPVSIAKYGELIGEAIYLPNIRSKEEAEKRAYEILNFLQLYLDGLTSPVVVGVAPPLMSSVAYTCKNGKDGREVPVAGVVTRKKVNYSGESGFTSSLEVSPGALSIVGPEELANYIQSLKDSSEDNKASITET